MGGAIGVPGDDVKGETAAARPSPLIRVVGSAVRQTWLKVAAGR
jgi:hypothetical protein